MRYYILLVFMVCLAGCSTSKVSYIDAQEVLVSSDFYGAVDIEGADSKVTFIRDSGVFGSACSFNLYINESFIATLSPQERVSVDLPSGEYIFKLSPKQKILCGSQEWKLESFLSEGQHKFYRIGGDMNGVIFQIESIKSMY